MRDYSSFSAGFWTGETGKQLHGDPAAQVVAAYLMTNRHANQIGLYYLPLSYAAHETGVPMDTVSRVVDTLSRLGFCRYDPATETVWVLKMARRQISRSPKAIAGAKRELAKAPDIQLKREFVSVYGPGLEHLHTVSLPYPEPKIPYPALVPRQDKTRQDKNTDPPAPPAEPPAKPVAKPKAQRPANPAFDAVVAVVHEEYAKAFPGTDPEQLNGGLVQKLVGLCGGDAEKIRAGLSAYLSDAFWLAKGAKLGAFVSDYAAWSRSSAKAPTGPANGIRGRPQRAAATTAKDFENEPDLDEQMKGWANG